MNALLTLTMALVLLLVSAALMEGVRYVKRKIAARRPDWTSENSAPCGTR